MIKSWTLEHFKSVYERTTLEMAPLTIFAGANSSGKSTLIQSLLLTAQTLQSPVQTRPVILNGHIVRLGAFDDVVSNGFQSNKIVIGFELAPLLREARIIASGGQVYYSSLKARRLANVTTFDCFYSFSAQGSAEEREVLQLQPRLDESQVRVNLSSDEKPTEEQVLIRRSERSVQERLAHLKLSQQELSRMEFGLTEFELIRPTSLRRSTRRVYGAPSTGKPVGVVMEHFLPGRIQVVFDAVEEQAKQLVDILTTGESYRLREFELRSDDDTLLNVDFKEMVLSTLEQLSSDLSSNEFAKELKITPSARKRLDLAIRDFKNEFSKEGFQRALALPLAVRSVLAQRFAVKTSELQKAARGNRPAEYTIAFGPMPDFPEMGVDYIQQFFNRLVKYLGPLRDEPKPVYPLAGATDPKDIGFRGEHTAAVLEVHLNSPVTYVPSRLIGESPTSYDVESVPLGHAVLDWLGYMGVASKVETIDKGKLGHELKVATHEAESLHDLTHVGVGVSQVLPILVLSLLADPGSTLIFEQPELHLHPRVQTRLADFFVSMTMLQKQCIVETHSEYLINRLRYRAAMSKGDEFSKQVIMYFVEKEKGHSTYRPIRINRFGVIEDWPKGFFDENEENATAILKAAMDKRKKEKASSE
jgi:predicted ATPase